MSKLMSSLLAVAVAGAFSMSAIAAEHGTAAPAATPAASAAPAAEKPAEAPKKAGASTSEAPAKK